MQGLGWGAWEKTWLTKHLPLTCWFNPQNPDKKLGAVSHAYNSRDGKMGGIDR